MVTVQLNNLSQVYTSGFRLSPVTLELDPGVTCLLGANGSGKSTLLRILTGIDTPSAGELHIHGVDGLMEREHVGFLPQDFSAPKRATCRDFLNYVAWSRRVPAKQRDAMVAASLARTGLSSYSDRKIRELSGGMVRRLGIAQAAIHEPLFLLLDEPTVGLDPRQRLDIRRKVRELSKDSVVLYSTHLVEDVQALADRALILRAGELVFDGTVADLEASMSEGPLDQESLDGSRLERGIGAIMGTQQ